eukprot:2677819-Amphidinium_carterae.1
MSKGDFKWFDSVSTESLSKIVGVPLAHIGSSTYFKKSSAMALCGGKIRLKPLCVCNANT